MATITDVARQAGVSVSTVSYALSGARPIRPATKARIEAAMAELGYQPNASARSLASRKTSVLAMLYPDADRGVGTTGGSSSTRPRSGHGNSATTWCSGPSHTTTPA
ncbi:LacI family DNA-binding transcriptional regulator [Tessaracoccus coleopterorum]|uniref:LacI family DNA-binding transcriptional regulator n=1 Tax=Tessaracoccus coleopterorum TaxID=2714950 RepID=UPI001E31781B|nr:LacI family DNA-binding transcriptional regulator [Tessaracoccus coleopterorum]